MNRAAGTETLLEQSERLQVQPSKRSWRPYPEDRPSGVAWLGDVPAHWRAKRLKYAVNLINEKVEEPGDLPYVGLEHIESWTGRRIESAEPVHPEGIANLFRPGDVLFGKLRPYLAKALHAAETGVCTSEALVMRPRLVAPEFLLYYVLNPAFISIVNGSTYGSKMPRANWEFIGNLPCLLPPVPEQQAIAAFLDRKTRQIDDLIEKKRRLIDLHHEKRTALISHAVTKGLNPAARMKPSGIDWLGDVPWHWEVKRLRHLVSEPLQYGANEAAELDDPALPRFVRITDVDEAGRLRDETFKSLAEDVARPFLLRDGDLLLARSGATVGKAFFYDQSWGRCCYAGYLIRARLHPARMVAKFAHYCTQSDGYWQWIASSFIQATIQNVSAEKYANLWIGVPPLAEQRAIVAHLDTQCAKLDTVACAAERAIAHLTEYRQAVISAAVTGDIDVREEVAS